MPQIFWNFTPWFTKYIFNHGFYSYLFIITRGSIKLFEATSISLSKSATTLFEIPSFYCFVGNPMPKFQLFPMVKPLVLCQKMFCLLIEWGFPLLKNIFPWIYISSLNIYLIFYNLGPWPICECAKKQPMVFSALACLKIPKKILAIRLMVKLFVWNKKL